MSPRYLMVVGEGAARLVDVLDLSLKQTGLRLAFSNRQILAFTNPACRCLAVADVGCVLGTLFHGHVSTQPLRYLDTDDARLVASSSGQRLVNDYWGGYVAAIRGLDQVRILRDPSGTFPCYYVHFAGFLIFASDAELLSRAGAIKVNFEAIGRQLCRAFVPAIETALSGICELLAGFAIRFPSQIKDHELCWSPWDHVAEPAGRSEGNEMRLARTVRHCVEAWASGQGRILLSVSGGLDSSVLAACLAKSRSDTVCLTMFSDDPTGDERSFARALCAHLKIPLIERPYRLEDVDITEPLAVHLPRPRDRTQANAYERVHLQVANEIGADAFMTGNGGDSVFGYSQSAAPIADRYLSGGLTRDTFAALLDVCRQTGCSMSDAIARAWRLAHNPPDFMVNSNPLFLESEFVESIDAINLHQWLAAPKGAFPGKAAHIASLLRVQPNIEASRGYHLPVHSALMSQPIIEACLGIPTWEWRAGGRDRSLARRAFANDLPPTILDRRVKGSPSGFAARLLDHFRKPIRERLLGGRLAANAIIDRLLIENVLDSDRQVGHRERVRILELVNIEAWIEHWESQSQSVPVGFRWDAHDWPHSAIGPTL